MVIAHQLFTLARIDRILVFQEVRIFEGGNHTEHLYLKGHYSRICSFQVDIFFLIRKR